MLNCGFTSEWNTLLAVQAGAAATLTGLVFVAVSLNLDRILSFPGLSGRAGESILQFLQIFFIATLALVPRQSTEALAVELLVIALCFEFVQVSLQIRFVRANAASPRMWMVYRATLSQLGTLPFFVAGIALLAGYCPGIYWLVPGFVFSFASALMGAWVLLIEIRR